MISIIRVSVMASEWIYTSAVNTWIINITQKKKNEKL